MKVRLIESQTRLLQRSIRTICLNHSRQRSCAPTPKTKRIGNPANLMQTSLSRGCPMPWKMGEEPVSGSTAPCPAAVPHANYYMGNVGV